LFESRDNLRKGEKYGRAFKISFYSFFLSYLHHRLYESFVRHHVVRDTCFLVMQYNVLLRKMEQKGSFFNFQHCDVCFSDQSPCNRFVSRGNVVEIQSCGGYFFASKHIHFFDLFVDRELFGRKDGGA
jgi:hypothetical protein